MSMCSEICCRLETPAFIFSAKSTDNLASGQVAVAETKRLLKGKSAMMDWPDNQGKFIV